MDQSDYTRISFLEIWCFFTLPSQSSSLKPEAKPAQTIAKIAIPYMKLVILNNLEEMQKNERNL